MTKMKAIIWTKYGHPKCCICKTWTTNVFRCIPTGGIHALHFLRIAQLKKDEKILIFGAGGCIGTYAVQLAHNLGAEVTVVDSADKLDMLRDIGAHHVIDFREEDFTNNDIQYDVIFDVARIEAGKIHHNHTH